MQDFSKLEQVLVQEGTNRPYLFTRELASRSDMRLYRYGKRVSNPFNSIHKVNPSERLSMLDAQLLTTENSELRRELQKLRESLVDQGRQDDSTLSEELRAVRSELDALRRKYAEDLQSKPAPKQPTFNEDDLVGLDLAGLE